MPLHISQLAAVKVRLSELRNRDASATIFRFVSYAIGTIAEPAT